VLRFVRVRSGCNALCSMHCKWIASICLRYTGGNRSLQHRRAEYNIMHAEHAAAGMLAMHSANGQHTAMYDAYTRMYLVRSVHKERARRMRLERERDTERERERSREIEMRYTETACVAVAAGQQKFPACSHARPLSLYMSCMHICGYVCTRHAPVFSSSDQLYHCLHAAMKVGHPDDQIQQSDQNTDPLPTYSR